MTKPRFQIHSVDCWPSAIRPRQALWIRTSQRGIGLVFSWRMLGANNRELARSARQGFSVQECERFIVELKGQDPRLLVSRIAYESTEHGWSWLLRSEQTEIAKSARSFHRRSECLASLARFRDAYVVAPVHLPTPNHQTRERTS